MNQHFTKKPESTEHSIPDTADNEQKEVQLTQSQTQR